MLLAHAKAHESLSDRDKIISELEEMNAKANELYSEISDLNSIISRELYPVDSVGKDKKELLEKTAERIKKLPPMEKRLIRSEFPSLQSMVHWITAGKDSLKG